MIWVCFLLALMIVAIPVLTIYLPYRRCPEKAWSRVVLSAYQAARTQVSVEAGELEQLVPRRQAEEHALAELAFERFLGSISVSELEAYPGIGPATIDRLRQRGYADLAKLNGGTIRVPGLGEKRATDVVSAVQQLTRDAESRFRSGACLQAQDLATALDRLALRHETQVKRAEARLSGAVNVARQLEKSASVARQVTFWRYFWKGSEIVVPPELRRLPLPDLEVAIRGAEQRAHSESPVARVDSSTGPPGRSRIAGKVADSIPIRDPTPAPTSKPVDRPVPAGITDPEMTRGTNPSAPEVRIPDPSALGSPAHTPQTLSGRDSLELIIEFVYAIARTDGSLARKEKELIEKLMERLHGEDQATLNRVRAYCTHYETASIDVPSSITKIKESASPAQRREIFSLACRIAEANGAMNQRERRLLERVSAEWDVPFVAPSTEESSVATPSSSPGPAPAVTNPALQAACHDPRSVLLIDGSAPLTAQIIRQQYQLLLARLAPEKVEVMGAEFVAMAERKRTAIQAAAEELIQPFGETLQSANDKRTPAGLRENPDLDAMFGA
jgi:uncharacterized tellurite resistance protein B-like protein